MSDGEFNRDGSATTQKLLDRIAELEKGRKRDCVDFFTWWWNQPGSNTDQGYDQWIAMRGETEAGVLQGRIAERDRLREALAEIREIYAGAEGIPVAETAAETYLVQLLEQMFKVAAEALAGGEGQQ